MNSNLNLKNGDQIKTTWGNWYTVIEVIDNMVKVCTGTQQYVHITKVIKVASK